MRIIIPIILTLISSTASADLLYFNRQIIIGNGIKELTEIIVSKPNKEDSCTAYRYRFDRSGNIISEGLARTSTIYRYHYDASGKIKDWSWKDKTSGEITYFSKVYETEPDNFANGLREITANHKKLLEKKIVFTETTTRKISDVCANIDAFYSILLKEEENGLPKIIEATLKKDGDHSQSPQKLYIIYKYVYFE